MDTRTPSEDHTALWLAVTADTSMTKKEKTRLRAIVSQLSASLDAAFPPRLGAPFGVRDEPPPYYELGYCVAALVVSAAITALVGDEVSTSLRDRCAEHIRLFLPRYFDHADAEVLHTLADQVKDLITAGNNLSMQYAAPWAVAQSLLTTIAISDGDFTASDREQYHLGFTACLRLVPTWSRRRAARPRAMQDGSLPQPTSQPPSGETPKERGTLR